MTHLIVYVLKLIINYRNAPKYFPHCDTAHTGQINCCMYTNDIYLETCFPPVSKPLHALNWYYVHPFALLLTLCESSINELIVQGTVYILEMLVCAYMCFRLK